jgi:hypothetical protein
MRRFLHPAAVLLACLAVMPAQADPPNVTWRTMGGKQF